MSNESLTKVDRVSLLFADLVGWNMLNMYGIRMEYAWNIVFFPMVLNAARLIPQ